MSRSKTTQILLFSAACSVLLLSAPTAEAGNGWGWKKPMNQKMGAFYTGNKKLRRSSTSSSSHSSRYRHSTHSTYRTVTPRTYHSAPVVVKTVPQTVMPIQPAPVTHAPSATVPPPTQTAPITTALPEQPLAVSAAQPKPATAKPVQVPTQKAEQAPPTAEQQALELLGPWLAK